MISGIGIDLIEVDRVAERVGRENGFKELVFSAGEIAYCEKMAHPAEHFAARFAAKEAFFKALGTGWQNGTAFNEVEVAHDEKMKPHIRLLGNTAAHLSEIVDIDKVLVSLSHIKTVATAIVIIEQ
jgi:holo-[acyl-carrier protein] synthase